MPRAQELAEVSPGIFVWQAYDSKVKAELFSTALETHSGTCLVDPIPLATEGLLSLRTHHPKTAGIFVTNANHARAAADFARTFSAPLYVHDELRGSPDFAESDGGSGWRRVCQRPYRCGDRRWTRGRDGTAPQ